MIQVTTVVMVNLVSAVCAVSATVLAYNGKWAWCFFLAVSFLLTLVSSSSGKQTERGEG